MKLLIQIVDHASVEIPASNTKNTIGKGLLIYLGISKTDIETYTEKTQKILGKLDTTKFFHNPESDKIDLSLQDINGEILLISNFTLYGTNDKGTKLDFSDSANFTDAKMIYDYFIQEAISKGYKVKTGEFGGMMLIDSLNNGPINVILEY